MAPEKYADFLYRNVLYFVLIELFKNSRDLEKEEEKSITTATTGKKMSVYAEYMPQRGEKKKTCAIINSSFGCRQIFLGRCL